MWQLTNWRTQKCGLGGKCRIAVRSKKFHVRSNGQFCLTLNDIENHNRDTMNIEGIESQNEYKW